jgi:hypothetical protein
LAVATSLFHEQDPLAEVYEQSSSLRDHLKSCLINGDIKQFPTLKSRMVSATERILCSMEEKVYCVCRSIDTGDGMVACSSCSDPSFENADCWWHGSCIGKSDEELDSLKGRWECPNCIAKKKRVEQ